MQHRVPISQCFVRLHSQQPEKLQYIFKRREHGVRTLG